MVKVWSGLSHERHLELWYKDNERLQKVKDFLSFCGEKVNIFANGHLETSNVEKPNIGEEVANQSESIYDNEKKIKQLEKDLADAAKLVEKAGNRLIQQNNRRNLPRLVLIALCPIC